jgi:nucleoside-diphosphate-sugar epimerase
MNKIIITGANGFLGKHVSKYFKKKYRIIELSSSKKTKKTLKWKMGNKLPIKNLNNTFFFHFAFDTNLGQKSSELKNNINFTETVHLSNKIEKKKN